MTEFPPLTHVALTVRDLDVSVRGTKPSSTPDR